METLLGYPVVVVDSVSTFAIRFGRPMSFQDLLDKYGKHCPHCGSGEITSRNGGPLMHKCLDCNKRFEDADAVIGKAAASMLGKGWRGQRTPTCW